MKKAIVILILILINNLVAYQYMHNTGKTSLRVDDAQDYLGGFVYHNMGVSTIDNLWRAFIVIDFEQFGGRLSHGRPNDSEPLNFSTFTLVENETLNVIQDSDSARSWVIYEDTTNNIRITQTVSSGKHNEYYIYCKYQIQNTGTTTIEDGKFLLFYDGDIPADDFDNDYCNRDVDHKAVYQFDPIHYIWTGYTFLDPNTVTTGNFEDWYHRGTNVNALTNLIENPNWNSSIANTDCAVYELISLGSLAPMEISRSIKFAFVVGESLKQLNDAIALAWGESTYVNRDEVTIINDYSIYPNPFNDIFTIDYNSNFKSSFELFDLSGRKVFNYILEPNSIKKIDANNLPSGIFLYRINNDKFSNFGKIIHLK